ILGSDAFSRADYPREWLVQGVAVKGRPGLIGGPQKSLKTSMVIDLIISLAAALHFLGIFAVPRAVRVLLISGESGASVVQETMRRVCRSKGIEPASLEGLAFWGFDLPRLS